MKLRGKEKNKFINYVLIIICTFILFACFLTLIMDIANNKGILPVIFFILMIYSLLMFFYYLFNPVHDNDQSFRIIKIKFSYLFFFVINVGLLLLSVIALWL